MEARGKLLVDADILVPRGDGDDAEAAVLKNGRLGKNAKLVAVGLIVGLVLGVCGTVFLQNWNPKDEEPIDQASVVFSRIVQQNKLVSASQDYIRLSRRRPILISCSTLSKFPSPIMVFGIGILEPSRLR